MKPFDKSKDQTNQKNNFKYNPNKPTDLILPLEKNKNKSKNTSTLIPNHTRLMTISLTFISGLAIGSCNLIPNKLRNIDRPQPEREKAQEKATNEYQADVKQYRIETKKRLDINKV